MKTKKKTATKDITTKEKEQVQSQDAIKYQGNVTVTIKKGKTIISSRSYHNNGGDELFKFLANCISGAYVESLRPKYIRAFDCKGSPGERITQANSTSRSAYIAINDVSSINGKATLHFTIPCSFILPDSGASTANINQLGLYSSAVASNSQRNDVEQYCAYYNFIEENGQWAPLIISTLNGDYNIFIEWEMSFN